MHRRAPPDMEAGRKVMVIADQTPHSASALQYALSHAVLEQDEVILVHVVNNLAAWKNPFVGFLRKSNLSVPVPTPSINPNDWLAGINFFADEDFLEQMRRACEIAKPKMRVRTERIEMGNKDKATAILSRSTCLGADVIIIGQKRSISSAILGKAAIGGSMKAQKPIDTADYLIENSQCTCVAVQKKGQKGGYLLNTKTHKNFWLLA